MFTVVTHQLGRHGFYFAAMKHIQKQGFQHIVAVVTEGNFGRAEFCCSAVKYAAAQPRTERTGGFTFRNFVFYYRIGVFFYNAIVNAQRF